MSALTLTDEQQKAYDAVLSADPGSITVLRGFAGTGKTLTASEIIRSGHFKTPLVVAPTAQALNALKRKFAGVVPEGTSFHTLAYMTTTPTSVLSVGDYRTGFKVDLDIRPDLMGTPRDPMNKFITWAERVHKIGDVESMIDYDYSDSHLVKRDVDTVKMSELTKTEIVKDVRFTTKEISSIAYSFSEYDFVIVDEYSMVSQDSHETLLNAVHAMTNMEDIESPVFLLCGDAGQLQPVGGTINDAIRSQPDHETVFELTKPMRSDDAIATLANRIRKGAALGSLASSPNPHVVTVSHKIDDLFREHRAEFVDADVTLTFKNATVQRLNTLIRAAKGFSGPVGVGESVIVNRNLYRGPGEIEWSRGEILKVSAVHEYEPFVQRLSDTVAKVVRKISEEDIPAAMDGTEQGEKEANEYARRAEQLRAGLNVVEVMLGDGTLRLVTLSDGFGVEGSDRYALVRADMDTSDSLKWRNQMTAVNRLRSLWSDADWQKIRVSLIQIDAAYALTVHKAQGSELGKVLYVVSRGEVWFQAKEAYDGNDWHAPYTAITRAKNDVKVLYASQKFE